MTVAKGVAAGFVAGLVAVGAAVASAATAAADPPPAADPAAPAAPGDPAPAAPQSVVGSALSGFQPGGPAWLQAAGPGASTGIGIPAAAAPDSDTAPPPAAQHSGLPDFLLSQTATPALPGSQPAGVTWGTLNSPAYLFGPNMKLDQQGQQSVYSDGATDTTAPPPSGRIDAIQRAHGVWHMGMGKLTEDQLGEPLPGTAPPPGTNIPVGTNWSNDQPPPGAPSLPAAPPGTPPPAATPPAATPSAATPPAATPPAG